MVEYTPKTLNIFFSRANDEDQINIYCSLCEKYDGHDKICLIDIDDKYDGVNDKLLEGILQEIKKCDIFVCILTPINNVDGQTQINNNVLFELGYAFSCINEENIYIFIKEDETSKKNFEKLRPSMLSSIKYKTYISYEDIDDIIQKKYDDFENNYENDFNDYALLDEHVVGLIKYDMTKILNDDLIDVKTKIIRMDHFCQNYKHNNVIEIIFLFIETYITIKQFDNNVFDWFFNFLSNTILDCISYKWINNKNNQVKVLNLLKVIQYKLFEKYKYLNRVKINKNRRNFAITIFELLKTKVFTYKTETESLLNDSLINNINGNYEIYVYLLKSLNNSNNTTKKDYYEDLILNSKNSYNTYIIM